MSVTAADIMRLPSLRDAKIAAGKNAMEKIISSVSVLEYAEPSVLQDSLFHHNEFYGSEIVITAFANIKDDVEAQCANIKRLADVGEVGIILYYVGILVPKVDERLIQLADSLDFLLIVMPEGRMDCRYSEVICEVMEAIFQDQRRNTSLVVEILERMSGLPNHQRTIDTVLKMISDRLRVSVALTDEHGGIINMAAWPRGRQEELQRMIREGSFLKQREETMVCGELRIQRFQIYSENISMYLLVLYNCGAYGRNGQWSLDGEACMEQSILQQVAEVMQLVVNLWGRHHAQVATKELVRAILQDEPVKMRRLAEIFHIDVASLHSMWILKGEEKASLWAKDPIVSELKSLLSGYSTSLLMDSYEGVYTIFMNGPGSLEDEKAMSLGIRECLDEYEVDAVLICCNRLNTTDEVRRAFLEHQNYLEDARQIFPGKRVFQLSEISFARQCREILEKGEASIWQETAILAPIMKDREYNELWRTLSVYLLDAQSGVTRTAEMLYVHKNTVKYRIRRCSQILGFSVGHQPESMELYRAAALMRLMSYPDAAS